MFRLVFAECFKICHRSSTNDVINETRRQSSVKPLHFKAALEDPFLSFQSYFGSNYPRLILRRTFRVRIVENPDKWLVLHDHRDFVHNDEGEEGDHYEDEDENCQIGHLKVAKGSG